MSLVDEPANGDQVFNLHDTKVFVAVSAGSRLDSQVLDARIDEHRATFLLAYQS